MKVKPATVIVPVRAVAAVFAATESLTEPLPLPELPWAMVIHVTPLAAVHMAVVLEAETAMLPCRPKPCSWPRCYL